MVKATEAYKYLEEAKSSAAANANEDYPMGKYGK